VKVVVQNDGDFMDVIRLALYLPHHENGALAQTSVSHQLSVNVTQAKGIADVLLSSSHLSSCSHDHFILANRGNSMTEDLKLPQRSS
jgi:hypothetical protein